MGPDSDAHWRPLAVAGKTDWGKVRARSDPGSHWCPLLARQWEKRVKLGTRMGATALSRLVVRW